MALPLKTTVGDIRDIVRYLKTKPTGATVTEAKAAVDKKLLDAWERPFAPAPPRTFEVAPLRVSCC